MKKKIYTYPEVLVTRVETFSVICASNMGIYDAESNDQW